MSKIRQALQLLADSGLSTRQVAAALGISKTTVSEIAMYARDAGVDWPLAATLGDDELQARLYPPPRPRSSSRHEPDYAALHQELKRPGVTLQLLWEEYRSGGFSVAMHEQHVDIQQVYRQQRGTHHTHGAQQSPTGAIDQADDHCAGHHYCRERRHRVHR